MDLPTRTMSSHNRPPSLLIVPLEVLLHISRYLTTPEYGNLRRTCIHIEASLLTSFSREFFTKRQFMLTEFSLQALVDISKSRFSSSLNYVILGVDRIPTPRPGPHPPQPPTHVVNQEDPRVQHNTLRQQYADHLTLLYTNQDVEMLAEAFSNLSNLQTVGIRDFYSRSRNRDFPNNEWRSYGIRTFEQTTGRGVEEGLNILGPYSAFSHGTPDESCKYLSSMFINLIRALGKANSRPENLEIMLRFTSLYDHAFNVPKYIEPMVNPVLGNLRTLFLDVNSEFTGMEVGLNIQCQSYLLRKFLARVPLLKHLRLNFQAIHHKKSANELLTWLSMPASDFGPPPGVFLLLPPPPVPFIHLRQLDIGMLLTRPHTLLGLIHKYRVTLRTISCHKIALLQPIPANDEAKRVNMWTEFFKQLAKIDLSLTSINMSYLSQEQEERQHIRSVTFKNQPLPSYIKKWAGPDMQSGLRDFISETTVNWPEHDTSSESGSSDWDTNEDGEDVGDDDDDDGYSK